MAGSIPSRPHYYLNTTLIRFYLLVKLLLVCVNGTTILFTPMTVVVLFYLRLCMPVLFVCAIQSSYGHITVKPPHPNSRG